MCKLVFYNKYVPERSVHWAVKPGSQYDAGTSVASQASEWRWKRTNLNSSLIKSMIFPASNQSDYLDVTNSVWPVKKEFSYDTCNAHSSTIICTYCKPGFYCVFQAFTVSAFCHTQVHVSDTHIHVGGEECISSNESVVDLDDCLNLYVRRKPLTWYDLHD